MPLLSKFDFKIDKRFKKRLKARWEGYEIQAGILVDKPHRVARHVKKGKRGGLGTLQGGPVRKMTQKTNGTVAEVSERLRKRIGKNYLTAPFRKNSKERREMMTEYFNLASGKTKSYSKFETALRRLIRTPILKKAYGSNSRKWASVKTFNRLMIDTGQFFKAITAKIRVKKVDV